MREKWNGIAASPGIAIGKVLWYRESVWKPPHGQVENVEAELERYHLAVARFCANIENRTQKASARVRKEQIEILNTHVAMAKDPYLNGQIEGRIGAYQCAEWAIEAACGTFMTLLSSSADELIRQRASDVKDVRDGLLRLLMNIPEGDLSFAQPGTVLVADELPPSVAAQIDPRRIIGIITRKGGTTSHSAILARAMEIPAVLGVALPPLELLDGEPVIVDGNLGFALISPSEKEISDYRKKQAADLKNRSALKHFIGKETRAADGTRIILEANVGGFEEAVRAAEYTAEGIGLLRTEYLYMENPSLPSEEEQLEAYRRVFSAVGGKPTAIRTLDIGGDKALPYLELDKEENPFLGYRAIRFSLEEKEMFRTQLRAILRAGAFAPVKLILPFVTSLREIGEVKEQLALVRQELEEQEKEYGKEIPLGVMVETPAAVIMAEQLAREVDFFSIGTNDLTQYVLSVDRGNPQVASFYSYFDPAVLRCVKWAVEKGREAGIPVSICGEAASDPLLTPVFLAFGAASLSVVPGALLSIRREISFWNLKEAAEVTKEALSLSCERQVKELLLKKRRG